MNPVDPTDQNDPSELGRRLVRHREQGWTRCRICNLAIYGRTTIRFCGPTHQRQGHRLRLKAIGRFAPGEVPSVDQYFGPPTDWVVEDPPHEANASEE